uniref:Sel1 repeat-containing protein n=1 Tax=Candidatus Kentrum sp. LFY TaxID=2126342 RepID=A0A450W8X2_9GAMM|nr:MAG: hypothetical protein BECKLFY1418C_GA0070996_100364 [Candidatus Kentron sp. LFY]
MHVDLHHAKLRHQLLEPHRENSRKWIRIVLLVMIVALIGWYFLGDTRPKGDNQRQLGKPPTAESDAQAAFRVPLAVRGSGKPTSTPSSTAVVGGDQARDLIQNLRDEGKKIDLDNVFRRAGQFEREGMLVDAYLMYFFAARQGHADSAIVLGTMYDPNHGPKFAGIIDKPDWGQAHKWYLRALDGGNQAAQERLEYLRKQVEDAAAKGDVAASRLVLQWQ